MVAQVFSPEDEELADLVSLRSCFFSKLNSILSSNLVY